MRPARPTHLGEGEKMNFFFKQKCTTEDAEEQNLRTVKAAAPSAYPRQTVSSTQPAPGDLRGGAGAQRGVMKVIPVCQRDILQEDGWEGQWEFCYSR